METSNKSVYLVFFSTDKVVVMGEPDWLFVDAGLGMDGKSLPYKDKSAALQSCKAAGYDTLCTSADLSDTGGSCLCGWTDDNGTGHYVSEKTAGYGEGDCLKKGWNQCAASSIAGAFCCHKPDAPPPEEEYTDKLGYCETSLPTCIQNPNMNQIITCPDCTPDRPHDGGIWLYQNGKRTKIPSCKCSTASKAAGPFAFSAIDGDLCGKQLLVPKPIVEYTPPSTKRKNPGDVCEYTEDCSAGYQCRAGDRRCLTESEFKADSQNDTVQRDGTLLTRYKVEVPLTAGETYYIRPEADPTSLVTKHNREWVVYNEQTVRSPSSFTLEGKGPQFYLRDGTQYLGIPGKGYVAGQDQQKIPWTIQRSKEDYYHIQCAFDMSYVTYEQPICITNSKTGSYLAICETGHSACQKDSQGDLLNVVGKLDTSNQSTLVWKFIGVGKQPGDPVTYGDTVGIQIMVPGSGTPYSLMRCESTTCTDVDEGNTYQSVIAGNFANPGDGVPLQWTVQGQVAGMRLTYDSPLYLGGSVVDPTGIYTDNYLDICGSRQCGDTPVNVIQTSLGRVGAGRFAQGGKGQWQCVRFGHDANPLRRYLNVKPSETDPWQTLVLEDSPRTGWLFNPLNLSHYIHQQNSATADCSLYRSWQDPATKWFTNGQAVAHHTGLKEGQLFYTTDTGDGNSVVTKLPTGKCEVRCDGKIINICHDTSGKVTDCNKGEERGKCNEVMYNKKTSGFAPTNVSRKCFYDIPIQPGDAPSVSGQIAGMNCDHSSFFTPRSIDAAIQVSNRNTDIFIGSEVYRVEFSSNAYRVAKGYPKPIGSLYPGIPPDLDAAFRRKTDIYFDGTTQKMVGFFFKGDYYYVYDMDHNNLLGTYRILDSWANVPSDLDATRYDIHAGAIYFYKGDNVYTVYPYIMKHGMYFEADTNTIQTLVILDRSPKDSGIYTQKFPQGKDDTLSVFDQQTAFAMCRLSGGVLASKYLLGLMIKSGQGTIQDTSNPNYVPFTFINEGATTDQPYMYGNKKSATAVCNAKGYQGLCKKSVIENTAGVCKCGWMLDPPEPGYWMRRDSPDSKYSTPQSAEAQAAGVPNKCGQIGWNWNICGATGGAYCCNKLGLVNYPAWLQDDNVNTYLLQSGVEATSVVQCSDQSCQGRGGVWCFYEDNVKIRLAGTASKQTIREQNENFPTNMDTIIVLPPAERYHTYQYYFVQGTALYAATHQGVIPLEETLATFIVDLPENHSSLDDNNRLLCKQQRHFENIEKNRVTDYKIDSQVFSYMEKAINESNNVGQNQDQQLHLNKSSISAVNSNIDSDQRQVDIALDKTRSRGSVIYMMKVILVVALMGILTKFTYRVPYWGYFIQGLLGFTILWSMWCIYHATRKNYRSHNLRWGLFNWTKPPDTDAGPSPPDPKCPTDGGDPKTPLFDAAEVDDGHHDGRTIPETTQTCKDQNDCPFCTSQTFHMAIDPTKDDPHTRVRICGPAPDGNPVDQVVIDNKWCVPDGKCGYCQSGTSHIQNGKRVCGEGNQVDLNYPLGKKID